MNKKIKIGLFALIILGIITLCLTYKSNDKIIKTKKRKQNNLAIMIKEDGATDYTKSNSKDIPKGDYVLNRDKSYCKNNGKIGDYDSSLGKVSFSFIGTDSCFLYFDYDSEPKGYEKILLDNGNGATTVDAAKAYIEGRTTSTTPDFSTVATTNEGMFAADDDYTATTGMKSYYFRGAVNNNWVQFGKYIENGPIRGYYNSNKTNYKEYSSVEECNAAESYNIDCSYAWKSGDDMYWRIIRINGDGSIRIIYSGTTAPTESTKVVMTGTGTQISESSFNSSYDNPSYVGYMYTASAQHGNSTSSTIKTTIDNWYKTTTLETDSVTKALVSQDQIFCNDRSATTSESVPPGEISGSMSTSTTYYYGAYVRLRTNKSPKLTCTTASDKFTSKKSSIGNKALDYPVGLITADEVAMGGGVIDAQNTSYYLYTKKYYWSGSPIIFSGSAAHAFEFDVFSSGELNTYYAVDADIGARPVISLSSKTKLLGDGTWNNVYRVTTDDFTEDTPSGKSFDTVFAANDTDIFNENGLRYEGADPNNYICLDNKTSGTCSSSSLLFRIIGLFDEDTSSDGTSSSGTKKLLKVIDTNNYGGTSGKYWNSAGTNNWSTASLKTELNGAYLNTLLGTSNVNSKLSSAIANTKWHLGGASSSNYNTLTAEGIYTQERNTSAIYSGNPSSIYAKVGLMYPSDYGYATVGGTTTNKSSCRAKELYNWDGSSYSDCKNNDWLFTSQSSFVNSGEWLLSPYSSYSNNVANLYSPGYVSLRDFSVGNNLFAVRPTFYLDSSVLKIVGGTGTSDNAYRIG